MPTAGLTILRYSQRQCRAVQVAPFAVSKTPRFLTGRGKYVEDVLPASSLHLAFVRSPYPSARITRIDMPFTAARVWAAMQQAK